MTGTVERACTVTPSLSMSAILSSGSQQFDWNIQKFEELKIIDSTHPELMS